MLVPKVQPLPDVVEVGPRARIFHLVKHLSYLVVVDWLSIGIIASRELPIIFEGYLLERFDVERLLLPRFELKRGRLGLLMKVGISGNVRNQSLIHRQVTVLSHSLGLLQLLFERGGGGWVDLRLRIEIHARFGD